MRGILRLSFGSGLERVDDMTGTDLRAVAALDTLGRIDLRHEILHMDRVGGAFPLALHAADAAHLADLHDLTALVLIAAAFIVMLMIILSAQFRIWTAVASGYI